MKNVEPELEAELEGIPEYQHPYYLQMWREMRDQGRSRLAERYLRFPVPIRVFIEDEDYLGVKSVLNEDGSHAGIWPAVMAEIEEINNGKYVEALLTGSIGSAKTTVAVYTQLYQLYLLSCLRDPHKELGLDRSGEILIIFQSINESKAREAGYDRFKTMVQSSPYFQQNFPFDKHIESKMVFPHRIEVKPVAGTETAAISQNVIGGLIDELNYMAVIEKSRKSVDGGGLYDQAVKVYNSIARRRKSRFRQVGGSLPGILCLASSRRYPGQFTDTKEKEAEDDPTIYVYDKRTWEVKPWAYTGEMFWIFIGDDTRKPFVVGKKDFTPPEGQEELYMEIPIEERDEFDKDIHEALREVAGVSTLSSHRFMPNTDAIAACFGLVDSILSVEETDFESLALKAYASLIANSKEPRWIHGDLAKGVMDNAGLACGHIEKFIMLERGDTPEIMPVIRFDFILEILPPIGGEIEFSRLRKLIYDLRDLGLPLKWISFDQYQSVDSQQQLRRQGFKTGEVSMDKKPWVPYILTKDAIYDQRLLAPVHEKAMKELVALEKDTKTGRIDHPPRGSKDLADSIAGVVYGLTRQKESWIRHGIPISRIPSSLVARLKARDQHDVDSTQAA